MEPFLACAVIAGHILTELTDRYARAALIAAVIADEHIVALDYDAGVDPFAAPQPTARATPIGYLLNDRIRCVRHADLANDFLVPRSAFNIQAFRLMDGAGAADLQPQALSLDADARLMLRSPARTVLRDARERGLLGLAAETLALGNAAYTATFLYLNERKQFGSTLASFQALQHRAADMAIAELELRSLLELTQESFAHAADEHQSELLAALKCVGEEGKGWQIAKFLLSNERVSIADSGPKLRLLAHLRARYVESVDSSSLRESLRLLFGDEIAALSIDLLTLCAMERQFVEAWSAGKPFGTEASMLKIRGTEILQSICELALKLEGLYAASHDPRHSLATLLVHLWRH